MSFKVKDSIQIGTATVFNASGQLTTPKIKDAGSAYTVALTPTTLTADRIYTLPDKAGTIAMTSDLGGATNDGTLGATSSTAGATNTGVEVTFSAAWSANSASNVTIKNVVGPAITGLASAMTGASAGFLKKTAADTYSVDTSTYLTTAGNAASATYASNLTIANDAATATSVYPTWVTASTGNIPQYTTTAKLSFVPSTGILTAAGFSGPLTGAVTGTASLATALTNGAAGAIAYQSGAGATTFLTAVATGSVLISGGLLTAPSWSSTPTFTGTNITGIPNTGLSNSTISGVSLGGTLAALSAGAGLAWSVNSTYTGAAVSTLAVDAAAAGTPSAWASVTTGSITIGGGLTSGSLNLATGTTGANTINIGNPNSTTVINGNWTVNGTTTTLNASTLTVDDKNVELGAVASGVVSTTGTVGTIGGAGPWTAVLTGMTSTAGLIVGSTLTATGGTGTLTGGGACVVTAINSTTSINYTATGGTTPTAGSVTNVSGGVPTNVSADGGGIILKGATDKTIIWDNTNSNWTSSEDWNLATGKVLKVNNVSTLSATTLGTNVVNSSLTKVGALSAGTAGFVKVDASGNMTSDASTYAVASSTHYIGTTAVALNRASANQAMTGILSTTYNGSSSGTTQLIPTAAASGIITMPAATGTMALTSDLPTVNAGTLSAAASTAGATNTAVETSLSAAWNANSASNVTFKNVVGPAITALATAMTGAGSGFLKKSAADTYTVDTNTYVVSGADTLQTVTTNGSTTSTALTFTNSTDSTDATTGAIKLSGGLAVTKNLSLAGEFISTTSAGTVVITSDDVVQATVATVALTAVDTWAVATFRSAKYLVQITQSTNYQVSEILVIHNGTTTFMTEYGAIETNGVLATFTSDVSAGSARLLVTMGSATSATINISKIAVRV